MRRDAGDAVSGRLQLGFNWDVTARSLLSLKLAALENVLNQRQEILCALNPVPASAAQRWTRDARKAPEAAAQVGQFSIRHGICFYGMLLDINCWRLPECSCMRMDAWWEHAVVCGERYICLFCASGV